MTQHWTAHLRRALLWAVPGVLLAALIWSLLPRGGVEPVPPAALPSLPAGQGRSSTAAAPSASGAASAPASPSSGGPASSSPSARTSRAAPPASAADARAASSSPRAGARSAAAGVATGEITLGNLVGTDDKGRTRWQIVADDMVLQQPQQTVLLKHVRATFFSADGTRMLVNGDRGTYDTRTRAITLDGAVHGVTSSGRELFADTVSYMPKSREVEGRGHVRVVEQRVVTYADRMISDLRLGETHFYGAVHISLR